MPAQRRVRQRKPHGHLSDRLDRLHRRVPRRRSARAPRRTAESAGARRRRARSRASVSGTRCSCIWIFRRFASTWTRASAFFAAILPIRISAWTRDDYDALVGVNRFGDSLRGFAQSQIREKLPQRQSARHAGSRATGPARAATRTACGASARSAPSPWPGTAATKWLAEDASIDWDRSDYDPYARTKKFCEHMVRELLPDVPRTVFRPSIVLGDSRRPETTQFDMVRAFVFLAGLAGAAVSARRPDRHRAGGLRRRRGRHAAPEAASRARDLSPLFRHRLGDISPA